MCASSKNLVSKGTTYPRRTRFPKLRQKILALAHQANENEGTGLDRMDTNATLLVDTALSQGQRAIDCFIRTSYTNLGWGLDMRNISVRVAEFHNYRKGGALPELDHYDKGSLVTVDIMLDKPQSGGRFQTLENEHGQDCEGAFKGQGSLGAAARLFDLLGQCCASTRPHAQQGAIPRL